MTTVRELVTRIRFDVEEAKLNKLDNSLNLVKNSLQKVADFANSASRTMVKFAQGATTSTDSLRSLNRATDLSTEGLQELVGAAELAGIAKSQFNDAILTLTRSINKANTGIGGFQNTFDSLGVAIKDSRGETRKTEDVFEDIVATLNKTEDAALRTQTAYRLFNDQTLQLERFAEFGESGAEGFRKLREEAKRLGLVLDEEAVGNLNRMRQSTNRLNAAFEGLRTTIGAEIAPVVSDVVDELSDWIAANRELIKTNIRGFIEDFRKAVNVLIPLVRKLANGVSSLIEGTGGFKNFAKVAAGLAIIGKVTSLLSNFNSKAKAAKEIITGLIGPVIQLAAAFAAIRVVSKLAIAIDNLAKVLSSMPEELAVIAGALRDVGVRMELFLQSIRQLNKGLKIMQETSARLVDLFFIWQFLRIEKWLKGVFGELIKGIREFIKESPGLFSITIIFVSILGVVSSLIGAVGSLLGGFFNLVAESVKVRKLGEDFAFVAKNVRELNKHVVEMVTRMIDSYGRFIEKLKSDMEKVNKTMKKGLESLKKDVVKITKIMQGLFSILVESIQGMFNKVMVNISEAMWKLVENVAQTTEFMRSLFTILGETIDETLNVTLDKTVMVLDRMSERLDGLIEKSGDLVDNVSETSDKEKEGSESKKKDREKKPSNRSRSDSLKRLTNMINELKEGASVNGKLEKINRNINQDITTSSDSRSPNGSRTINNNVDMTVNLDLPKGSQAQQAQFIRETADDSFSRAIQRELENILDNNPEIE